MPPWLQAVLALMRAIPGYFTLITIDGGEAIGRRVHSITTADVLRNEHSGHRYVSSMSTSHGLANGADGLLRWSVHRRFEREINRLRENGAMVIQLEPGSGHVTPWACAPWPRIAATGH